MRKLVFTTLANTTTWIWPNHDAIATTSVNKIVYVTMSLCVHSMGTINYKVITITDATFGTTRHNTNIIIIIIISRY